MLRMRNKYCSNCLKTQRFLDLGAYLVCERCSKQLERVLPVQPRPEAKQDIRSKLTSSVPWMERIEPRREAM